ncbi:hypothetical protein [Jannaschia donghaensis]|uniref:Putative integral membrane protein n=1 Tax=Jannaschia donghaensis TaxID=420998 RepID=A0A0M6YPX0_9RHOB|nr:hypothetical protein [Jannaschia donghaensis]CTQ51056.1 putative integral membrane protein [Jannaschia donghaensis]
MKSASALTVAVALILAAPAFAEDNGNNGNGNSRAERVANPSNGGCPPGLAKKDPPCVPPGQARQRDRFDGYDYRIGDRLDRDYVIVDRRGYDLPPLEDGEAYVRVGDRILRLDRAERLILDIVATVLN